MIFVKSGFRYEVKTLMILLYVDKRLCDFAHVFGLIVSSGEKTNKNLVASSPGLQGKEKVSHPVHVLSCLKINVSTSLLIQPQKKSINYIRQ